ncbi:MAG: hypothetical protein ACLFP4_11975 [Spirochaetales bacterium]
MFSDLASVVQFYWPGLVFTVTQSVVLVLVVWVSSVVTRYRMRKALRGQDTEELRQMIIQRNRVIEDQATKLVELHEENGRLRATIVSNTALAAQLLENHQQFSTQKVEYIPDDEPRIIARR